MSEGPPEWADAAAGLEADGAAGGGRMGGGRRSLFLLWMPPELTLAKQPELPLPRRRQRQSSARKQPALEKISSRVCLFLCAREEEAGLFCVDCFCPLDRAGRWILGLKAPLALPQAGHRISVRSFHSRTATTSGRRRHRHAAHDGSGARRRRRRTDGADSVTTETPCGLPSSARRTW